VALFLSVDKNKIHFSSIRKKSHNIYQL